MQDTTSVAYTEKADVFVVYPPLHRLYGEHKQWMPLSILYLTAYLNEHGISAKAYNADCSLIEPERVMSYSDRFKSGRFFVDNLKSDNYIWEEIKQAIHAVSPSIIGISVFTEALGSTKKLISIARNYNPNITIIAGGPHAEIDPEYLIDSLKVDYVIKGDGERTFFDVCKYLLYGSTSNNSLNQATGQRIITSVRISPEELPIPKLEYHYRYEQYRKVGKKLNISTSRGGCVYACKFCYCSKYKYSLQFRSVSSVIEEIEYYISHYRTKKIFFVDDTFTIKPQYVKDICNRIIDKHLDFNWTCTTRAKQLSNDLLSLMKQAGCKSIHLGVESGSPRMLELIDKKISIDDVINASKMIKAAGIECRLFFMAGLPTEKPSDLQMTIDLIKLIQPDETIISMYVPIPGTPLYDMICEQYYPFDKLDWTTFSRDKTPYHSYIDDDDNTYDMVLEKLYQIVEIMNSH